MGNTSSTTSESGNPFAVQVSQPAPALRPVGIIPVSTTGVITPQPPIPALPVCSVESVNQARNVWLNTLKNNKTETATTYISNFISYQGQVENYFSPGNDCTKDVSSCTLLLNNYNADIITMMDFRLQCGAGNSSLFNCQTYNTPGRQELLTQLASFKSQYYTYNAQLDQLKGQIYIPTESINTLNAKIIQVNNQITNIESELNNPDLPQISPLPSYILPICGKD